MASFSPEHESPLQSPTRGSDESKSDDTMAPSTLDIFVLTFNCAKNFITTPVFAGHIQDAFQQSGGGLPEVVVFSLQEVAPLAYSFIGSYFLNPYLARYEEALNLAASRHVAESATEDDLITVSTTPKADAASDSLSDKSYYTLVRSRNVGMTVLMLFARDPAAVTKIQEAEVGFGAAEMGNKGAVGVRFTYESPGEGDESELRKSGEFTFVATHLAAMEWNLARRNANWASIVRGLTFENPEDIVKQHMKALPRTPSMPLEPAEPPTPSVEEYHQLLHDEDHAHGDALRARLQDISVFRPTSYLFLAGDLNYRISTRSPPPFATFPSLDPSSDHYYPRFFVLDQLTREKNAGRTLHGLSEAPIDFPPSYKYDILPAAEGRSDEDEARLGLEVPWAFAPHRYPSWTDRVLYLDVPSWVPREKAGSGVIIKKYGILPVVRTSDHRPVYLRAEAPLLSPEEMLPPKQLLESASDAEAIDSNGNVDPRLRLPVELDPEAWERRAVAKRRETMAGWSMFLWSTRQGALVLGTVMAVGVTSWWLAQSW